MKSILLCIDSSDRSIPITEIASELARLNGARIYLFHIGSLAALMKSAMQRGKSNVPPPAGALERGKTEIGNLQRRLQRDGLDAQPVISAQHNFQGLVNAVEDLKADLILLPQELPFRPPIEPEDLHRRSPDIAARLLRAGMTI